MSAILLRILREHKLGSAKGIFSVCSAHPTVLEASARLAAEMGMPLLVESTSNQVNQEGGYTGMAPAAPGRLQRGAEAVHVRGDPGDGGDHDQRDRDDVQPDLPAVSEAGGATAALGVGVLHRGGLDHPRVHGGGVPGGEGGVLLDVQRQGVGVVRKGTPHQVVLGEGGGGAGVGGRGGERAGRSAPGEAIRSGGGLESKPLLPAFEWDADERGKTRIFFCLAGRNPGTALISKS
jgi:hypothetical protein